MPPGDDGADLAAGYIARWRPSSLSPQAAAFARDVIAQVAPEEKERAKNLLWAAGKLADFGIGLGLDAVPEVLLHPSAAERFTRCAPGLSGVARRTLRTNLRFIGRRVVPQLYPADMQLPREHSKEPYSPAEIGGYLALADAQPTLSRRMRGAGLVCLGAGAGLIRADLRAVHGTDVTCRSDPGQEAEPVSAEMGGAGRADHRRDDLLGQRQPALPPLLDSLVSGGGQGPAVGRDRPAFPAHDPHRVGVMEDRIGQVGALPVKVDRVGRPHHLGNHPPHVVWAAQIAPLRPDRLEQAAPQFVLDAIGDRLGVGGDRRPGVAHHRRRRGGQSLARQGERSGLR